MTPEQHAEIMRTLNALAKQGQAVRDEVARLGLAVAELRGLGCDIEAAVHLSLIHI